MLYICDTCSLYAHIDFVVVVVVVVVVDDVYYATREVCSLVQSPNDDGGVIEAAAHASSPYARISSNALSDKSSTTSSTPPQDEYALYAKSDAKRNAQSSLDPRTGVGGFHAAARFSDTSPTPSDMFPTPHSSRQTPSSSSLARVAAHISFERLSAARRTRPVIATAASFSREISSR